MVIYFVWNIFIMIKTKCTVFSSTFLNCQSIILTSNSSKNKMVSELWFEWVAIGRRSSWPLLKYKLIIWLTEWKIMIWSRFIIRLTIIQVVVNWNEIESKVMRCVKRASAIDEMMSGLNLTRLRRGRKKEKVGKSLAERWFVVIFNMTSSQLMPSQHQFTNIAKWKHDHQMVKWILYHKH